MAFFAMFKKSFRELKDVRCICVTGILIALYIVIEVTFTPLFSQTLKINLAFIPLAIIGLLYGPIVCMLAAIPCDILGAAFQGNGIIFIFTLIAMFEGVIYGLFLYGYKPGIKFSQAFRIFGAQSIVILISHLVFNTAALYFLGFAGQSYESVFAFIVARVIKNLIELPISCFILFIILGVTKNIYVNVNKGKY